MRYSTEATRIDIQQGTKAWLELRKFAFTASDAAAVVGANPYKSAEIIIGEKLGIYHPPEESPYLAFRKAQGHEAEDLARPKACEIIGEVVMPLVLRRDVQGMPFLASFDGITLDLRTGWEHKLWNDKYAAVVLAEEMPPEIHVWQLEHQVLVAGCERVLYMVSDGMDRMVYAWYQSDPERREKLIEGWRKVYEALLEYGWES